MLFGAFFVKDDGEDEAGEGEDGSEDEGDGGEHCKGAVGSDGICENGGHTAEHGIMSGACKQADQQEGQTAEHQIDAGEIAVFSEDSS